MKRHIADSSPSPAADMTNPVFCPECNRCLFRSEMQQAPTGGPGRVFVVKCRDCRKKHRIVLFDPPSDRAA